MAMDNDCFICGKELIPTNEVERIEAGIFGVHLKCNQNQTQEDIDKFIKDYEREQTKENNAEIA